MRRALFLSLAFTLALGAKAAAQTCTGMPSFSAGQMQLAAGGSFADGASTFGGTFGYGVPKSFYGKAALGTTSYDAFDGSSLDFGLSGGYQVPLQSSRTMEVCPVASLSVGSGPNDVLGSGVAVAMRKTDTDLKKLFDDAIAATEQVLGLKITDLRVRPPLR